MPELPEVETVRQTLKQLVLGKTINDVTIHWGNIIKQPAEPESFKRVMIDQTLHDIDRMGKFLIFQFDDVHMVSHLRMEGKFAVHPSEEPMKKHTHVIFHFTDGTELRYNDVRKFGTMHAFPKGEERKNKPLTLLGPDPFDPSFTLPYFYEKVKRTTRSIKAVLLDQSVVAGLGNIYVDETLFRAGVHPERRGKELAEAQVEAIRIAAIETINEAIQQGGTTIRTYVNSQGQIGMFQQKLYVYGKENEACQQCGTLIEKMKHGGRGTHYCRTCQH
ncbi:DNA-formamidopyrimidine glycosylase [Thalassobacillus hwangdonensis]|uniref:Formamidopyrimidine-DNA glycosylase n=1 Tax=Thalassobacillus hwangdonensis TaxID=546108 RepID=A0ABW3KZL7_9BACI